MRYLCLLFLLIVSTSFQEPKNEETWIGSFDVFFNNKTNEFIVYYDGNYHRCFTKFIIDELNKDCEQIIDQNYLRENLKFKEDSDKTDSIILVKPKLKIIQM